MIIDLTEKFFEQTGTSRSSHTQSNWHSSIFIKTSTSYLADLSSLDFKLNDLQKSVRSGSRFERDVQNKKILNVKEHLKLCEQNIKKLKQSTVDIKSRRETAERLKDSILITMELKQLQATFRFKDIHLTYAKRQSKDGNTQGSERQINLSRSHFLEASQEAVMQQAAIRQYKQIQKSIVEVSQMYKQTLNVVRYQQILVDNIESYIDDTDGNVNSGRKHLTELNSKQQQNRRLIYKVFAILYTIVFIYLVFLA